MTKHTIQYLRKREYIGTKNIQYWLRYNNKNILVTMKWVAGEYMAVAAKLAKYDPNKDIGEFPYRRTPKVIDRIEELLK